MKYKISIEAQKDIENIWLYTFETWSVEQADRYYNLILDEKNWRGQNFLGKALMKTRQRIRDEIC